MHHFSKHLWSLHASYIYPDNLPPTHTVEAEHRWWWQNVLIQSLSINLAESWGREHLSYYWVRGKIIDSPTICRHFQTRFVQRLCLNLHWHLIERCSQRPKWQYFGIGSDAFIGSPNRRQAVIWTNDGLFYQHIYGSLCLSKLTHQHMTCMRYHFFDTSNVSWNYFSREYDRYIIWQISIHCSTNT